MAVISPSFARRGVGTVSAVAVVRPFRALRYDPAVGGPLDSLVAPPYDVIGPEQREELLGRSPYNVVHLTLPDSEEEAAASLADWQERGVLVREHDPRCWWLAQSYVGPDGVARLRAGFVAALRLEPYENRVVLPHERTHAGPKEGRLRLLRATRMQLEPLFFLWDGTIEVDGLGEPELEVLGEDGVVSWLWRLDAEFSAALVEELADAQLLIADGHHRYETALAFHEEDRGEASAWLLAVIVPTGQEGLTIFPTHRVAQSAGDAVGQADRPAARAPSRARCSTARDATSCSPATASSTRRSSTGSHRAGSPTRRSARRRSPRSIAARRRRPSCCAPRGSRTSGPSRAAAT